MVFLRMTWGRVKKITVWTVGVLVGLFALLVIARMPVVYWKQETAKQVEKIHGTMLTLDDVMGKNLPPDPGAEADKTIVGIDANTNGIRDDVELAIFKEYPNSAKIRAVLLQYALALQMEMIQPIVNQETVIAAVQEEDQAYLCIGDIVLRTNEKKFDEDASSLTLFVKEKQINTDERKQARSSFYKKIGSYNSLDRKCDIDYASLPN